MIFVSLGVMGRCIHVNKTHGNNNSDDSSNNSKNGALN